MTGIAPVEMTIHVPAAPADVFAYLTSPADYVRWMGSEASLDEELRAGHDVAWKTYLPRLAVAAAGGDPGPDPHA